MLILYTIGAVIVAAAAKDRGYGNQPAYPASPVVSDYPAPGLAKPSRPEPVYPSPGPLNPPQAPSGSYGQPPYPGPKPPQNAYNRPEKHPRPHHQPPPPKVYSPPLKLDTYVSPVSRSQSVSPPYSDPFSQGHGPTYSSHTSQTFVASVYPEGLPQRFG
ncbi:unnamed protein product [Chrysodeixis includens]|uniref:Uncharacterized protein n=1 Tax=Chrysodeixis includens TaxID=689277 RepID=A0A9P0BNP7_CHRIL|nr:unnamed protein product [Chrysodeixis includens]